MTIQTIMTADPLALRDNDTVSHAENALLAKGFINLPVIDGQSRYLGMFGVFELLAELTPRSSADDAGADLPELRRRLKEVRTKVVGPLVNKTLPVLHPDSSIGAALRQFHQHRCSLPVVDQANGRLRGIVSYWDALGAVTTTPK